MAPHCLPCIAYSTSCGEHAAPYLPPHGHGGCQLHRQSCGSSTSSGQPRRIAITWCAFFAFLRSGEFTCPTWAAYRPSMLSLRDVSIDSQSCPSVVHMTLRQSKTDIFGAGVTIHLGRTGDTLCPVSALLEYLARRPSTPGPLFLLQSGEPLQRASCRSCPPPPHLGRDRRCAVQWP